MARKNKTNNRKGKEPSVPSSEPFPLAHAFSATTPTSAPRAERHRPQCLPQSYLSHPDPGLQQHTKRKVADPFQDTQSPRHVPEKRGSCSIVPTWRSKRSTSLADATLDASLPFSKAPSAHRSMSPVGRMTYGGSRITPATHARRWKPAESHPQGLPAHTSSKHPRVRSHARAITRTTAKEKEGNSGSHPGPQPSKTRPKEEEREGSQRRKEERENEEREKEREEHQSRHQPTHTHTHTGGGGARNKNKRQERLPQLPPDARPEPNTNRSRNGKNHCHPSRTLRGQRGGCSSG